MYEENLITDIKKRDELANRFEVLDKVKALLLINKYDMATTEQIATFYEVKKDAVHKIWQRNQDEILKDGIKFITVKGDLAGQNVQTNNSKSGGKYLRDTNGEEYFVPNVSGLRLFSRRAILRIGMLLRDSKVASEVRTQLLNIEEKAAPAKKVADINEEQNLLISIAKAYASGKTTEMLVAAQALDQFRQRHIRELETTNAGLKSDNHLLAKDALSWGDRASLNAGMRRLATVTGKGYGEVWGIFYRELEYKHGICLKRRGKAPYLNYIKKEEWPLAMQSFAALCVANGTTASEMVAAQKLGKNNVQ